MIHIGIEITNIAINVLGKCAKEGKVMCCESKSGFSFSIGAEKTTCLDKGASQYPNAIPKIK